MQEKKPVLRFVTLYEKILGVELVKSPGMIPYYLGMLAKGRIETELVGYRDSEDYPEAEKIGGFVRLNLVRPKSRFDRKWHVSLYGYILRNAKTIDILHLYHFRLPTFLKALLYKFLNPKGRIYLKLDADWNVRSYFKSRKMIDPGFIFRAIVRKGSTLLSDWISVETPEIEEYLRTTRDRALKRKLFLNYYGIDAGSMERGFKPKAPKENILLTISRLGTFQKNTPFLLEVLKKVIPGSGWKAVLVGPVDKDFEPAVEKFYQSDPKLREQVIFPGNIGDRAMIMDLLNRSKIFCLTSRHESWAIVLTEALYFGCYIATTNVGCAPLVVTGEENGFITETNEIDRYASLLTEAMKKKRDWATLRNDGRDRAAAEFSWERVVKNLMNKTGLA